MKTEIISIGDELLIGQTINTNAGWMGQELNKIGVDVHQVTVITDNEQHIRKALDESRGRVDLVLVTGGLGPTKDDITKTTLADYFHTRLIENEEVLAIIKERLKVRKLEMNELNRKQALVPEIATIFLNNWGTAPGMWFEDKGTVFVSMPGVPGEMKGLMTEYILPAVAKKFNPPVILHKTLLTLGSIEARLADLLEAFENELPTEIKLAYLPTSPIIKLRLSARGKDRSHLETLIGEQVKKLYQIIPDLIFGTEPDSLEEIVGKLLSERKQSLSTAESCTGGNISRLITSVPGSSEYFKGAVVAYANEVKINTLNVPAELIEKQGAVSKEVVLQMAKNVKELFETDYAIAISGIAGPSGGTAEKPVGTTWLAIAGPDNIIAYRLNLGGERGRNIHMASLNALNLLRKIIIKAEK